MADTFVLKGCWKRKEVVHALANKSDVILLANTHPWTINSTPALKMEYTRLYGQSESDVLMVKGKPNMVEAFEPTWVQGGVKVEADPKPTPEEGGVQTPFGSSQSASGPMDLSKDCPDLAALIDGIMVSVLKRAGLWKENQ